MYLYQLSLIKMKPYLAFQRVFSTDDKIISIVDRLSIINIIVEINSRDSLITILLISIMFFIFCS